MADWSHQPKMISDARTAYAAGHRRILLALATGGGKTRIVVAIAMGHLAKTPGGKVLFIAHLHELLGQAREAIRAAGGTPDRVLVESVQTLGRRGVPEGVTCVIVDECHHAAAATYQRVLAALNPPLLLGCTATPSRLDGKALGDVYSVIVSGPQPRELIAAGVLVPTRIIAPEGLHKSLAANPVDAYRRHAPGRKAIIFAASVEHAEALAAEFTMAGYPAANLDGRLHPDERRRRVEAFGSGAVQILTNYRLVAEGFNVPDASCTILASNMGSPAMFLQANGRSKRSAPGKLDAICLDLCGVSQADGLDIHPDDDFTYSLEGRPIKRAGADDEDDPIHVRKCPECGTCAPVPEFRASRCPDCGYRREGRPNPRVVKAELEEREREALAARAAKLVRVGSPTAQALAGFWRDCDERGHKRGAAMFRFKARFFRFPNAAERAAAERILSQEVAA